VEQDAAIGSQSGCVSAAKPDRPTGAVIGLGNRGRGIAEWQFPPFVDVVAICDVDLRKTAAVADEILRQTGPKFDIYQDYRRVLGRADIDVIANATCEHWQTKINVKACPANKDVYAEKPLSLTIDEGKLLRRVVKETERVIQVKTQQRSGVPFQVACSLVRGGRIGKHRQVAVIVPEGKLQHGRQAVPAPTPSELDWNTWSGPAPLHPFSPDRLTYGNWLDYGGGLVTDWGAHHTNIAHWGMGGAEVGPLSVEAAGHYPSLGKPDYPDAFRPFAARLEYPRDLSMHFFS
jgi:predicted dehydrogenase